MRKNGDSKEFSSCRYRCRMSLGSFPARSAASRSACHTAIIPRACHSLKMMLWSCIKRNTDQELSVIIC